MRIPKELKIGGHIVKIDCTKELKDNKLLSPNPKEK